MSLVEALNIVSTLAIVAGLLFAGWQVRLLQQQSRREAALQLIQNYQSPEFVRGIWLISTLPDGLSKAEIEQRLGDGTPSILVVMFALENIGFLVSRGEISIELVQSVFMGPTTVGWRKLERYVKDLRTELNAETPMEYFQWLAERLARHHAQHPLSPAYARLS